MLTGYQCEVVAYLSDCEFLCRDCAASETSQLTVEKADLGLANSGDLHPIIRYVLDEHNGQRIWEEAEERVRDFQADHPAIWEALVERNRDAEWRLTDRVAENLGDAYCEHCGGCGELLG